MTVMSIIACKIMQDEIVWLFKNDTDINKIIIVKNENIYEFVEKLDEQDISYEIVPFENISQTLENNENKYSVIVNMLELGLHAVPKILKSEVYKTIENMMPFSTGILLFYGMCGNVLTNVETDFNLEKNNCIVRILKDDIRVVDDCIGATIGGGKNYLNLLKSTSKEPAFFFTPMFADTWKELVLATTGLSLEDDYLKVSKQINDLAGYSRVAKINTGLNYVKNIDKKIEEYAQLFGYSIFEITGNQEIFEKCYSSMKKEVLNTA